MAKGDVRLRQAEWSLKHYKEALKNYTDMLEVKAALEQPIQLNLQNVRYYSAYYRGAQKMASLLRDVAGAYLKGNDKVYFEAMMDMITRDIRNTEMYMTGNHDGVSFSNHQMKGKKLVSVEAHICREVRVKTEMEV